MFSRLLGNVDNLSPRTSIFSSSSKSNKSNTSINSPRSPKSNKSNNEPILSFGSIYPRDEDIPQREVPHRNIYPAVSQPEIPSVPRNISFNIPLNKREKLKSERYNLVNSLSSTLHESSNRISGRERTIKSGKRKTKTAKNGKNERKNSRKYRK